MLAQAMASTMPVIANNKIKGVRVSPWSELCPRHPSVMTSSLALKRFIVGALTLPAAAPRHR